MIKVKILICILLIEFFSLIFANNLNEICGLKLKNRIVGGSESTEHAWPWTVSIHYNYKHICGGTLINNQWILTAAHCFEFATLSAYKVILGAHNITEMGLGTSALRLGISEMILHESYTGRRSYDIALLKLNKPVSFSLKILPACLPNLNDNYEGMNCYFTGWGYSYSGGFVQDILREIVLPVLNATECKKYAPLETEQKYCTGKVNVNQDTCQGDSGAGMYCLKQDSKFYVGGIVSYGNGPCGTVGINARVDYFINWILNKIKN